ncbi:MAG: HAMP domain-containing histidine kinase [Planctomycetes bacterium]|nr:HAMP domain-containing histidine kinase [Planctomycetota bacterium]
MKPGSRASLGSRLLTGQLLILVLVFAGVALAVHVSLEKALLAQVEGRVLARLSWLESGLEFDKGVLEFDPKRDATDAASSWEVRLAGVGRLWASDQAAGAGPVLSRQSELVMREGPTGELKLVAMQVDDEGDTPAMPPLYRVDSPAAGLVLQVEASESTEAVRSHLAGLRLRIAGTGLLGLFLLAIGFWAYVRASVKPLEDVAAAVGGVDFDRLDERLEDAPGPSEVAGIRAAVNHMLDRLEEGSHYQARFAALASHELRTPLAGIRLEAELALRRNRGEQDCREALGGILEETRRLEELVQGLLLLARHRHPAGCVDGCLELDDLLEESKDAAPGRVMESDAPTGGVLLRGDLELLAMALRNLLRNAVLHGRTAAPRVRVELLADHVDLLVADDGPGFLVDPQGAWAAPREPGTASPHSTPGLGLGLARRAAEACGAELVVLAADPDHPGAVVRLRLARVMEDGAPED